MVERPPKPFRSTDTYPVSVLCSLCSPLAAILTPTPTYITHTHHDAPSRLSGLFVQKNPRVPTGQHPPFLRPPLWAPWWPERAGGSPGAGWPLSPPSLPIFYSFLQSFNQMFYMPCAWWGSEARKTSCPPTRVWVEEPAGKCIPIRGDTHRKTPTLVLWQLRAKAAWLILLVLSHCG